MYSGISLGGENMEKLMVWGKSIAATVFFLAIVFVWGTHAKQADMESDAASLRSIGGGLYLTAEDDREGAVSLLPSTISGGSTPGPAPRLESGARPEIGGSFFYGRPWTWLLCVPGAAYGLASGQGFLKRKAGGYRASSIADR
jgi:hypothetical protein